MLHFGDVIRKWTIAIFVLFAWISLFRLVDSGRFLVATFLSVDSGTITVASLRQASCDRCLCLLLFVDDIIDAFIGCSTSIESSFDDAGVDGKGNGSDSIVYTAVQRDGEQI